MSKKSEFYDLANLYSSEILNEGFLGRTASGAAKGAGAGGLLGGVAGAGLGALAGGLPGAALGGLAGGAVGAGKGALIGGVANAAVGRDDDEEEGDSIEIALPKSDISCICKALKKALGAEEDSEEEYSDEEDDSSEEEAEDSFVNSVNEYGKTQKGTGSGVSSTTSTPGSEFANAANKFSNTEKGTGSLLKPVSQDAPKDLVSAYKSYGAPNTAPAGSLDYGWAPPADAVANTASTAAGSGIMDTAKGALAGAGEAIKGVNPWLLGGLAAGGGLLAGKMLSGDKKENKEEEEDDYTGSNYKKEDNIASALSTSRKEISSRINSALNSLEEFDIKRVASTLKQLMNDL